MQPVFGRREFLAGSGRMAIGLAAASVAGKALGAPGEKAEENKVAEKKTDDWCLACRDAHLAATGKENCWMALDAIGARGVEVSIGDDLSLAGLFMPERQYTLATANGIDILRADLNAAGRRITAFCMSNAFDARPDFEVRWVVRAAEAAQALDVKAIRIDVVPRKTPPAEFLDFAVGILKRVIAATESTGVALGIENHGNTTNNPAFLKPLFDRVGSDRLGLTLDTGNFYWFGHPFLRCRLDIELTAVLQVPERVAECLAGSHRD
ncbi:MAG: sugar phosphate isomerase/epimerase, partial [bacterium]|nr:sugar phosphate isomerase/epimerase [bacterium]